MTGRKINDDAIGTPGDFPVADGGGGRLVSGPFGTFGQILQFPVDPLGERREVDAELAPGRCGAGGQRIVGDRDRPKAQTGAQNDPQNRGW